MRLACSAALAFGLTALAAAPSSASVAVGDAAPNFTLPSSDGREIQLSDVLGEKNVVLAFFPKAFTGG